MRWVRIIFLLMVVAIFGAFLHYTLPQRDIVRITKTERETAVRAARAFGLGVAGVDLLRSETGPKVLEVNSSPGLEGVEKATKKNRDQPLISVGSRSASTIRTTSRCGSV